MKDKKLALFFTEGVSLKDWFETGMIDREVAIYNEFAKFFKKIYFFTYGGEEDLKFNDYLADNIVIIPKKYVSNNLLYSFMIPLIHHVVLKNVYILKTNQILGSWSAVLTKIIFRKKLLVRAGYLESINLMQENPKDLKTRLIKNIEKIAYKFADGVITTSQKNFDYVIENYKPRGIHLLIPNYVETNRFKPMNEKKKKGSICFIGRLHKEKNILALLEALRDLPYTVDIIGSGEQLEELERFTEENNINANFLGNILNHRLPEILNQHEIFILPSLWEGMPKTLLEAMSCGLPVIGTEVTGISEVIEHGKNGILCDTDPNSIKEAIIELMEDDELKQRLGMNARKTILEKFSLEEILEKELKAYEAL